MEYIYSLYDPQTNKLLYSGTPEQLACNAASVTGRYL